KASLKSLNRYVLWMASRPSTASHSSSIINAAGAPRRLFPSAIVTSLLKECALRCPICGIGDERGLNRGRHDPARNGLTERVPSTILNDTRLTAFTRPGTTLRRQLP